MLKSTEQTARKYRIAALNARLHQRGICPANHDVDYGYGWYRVDENLSQRPDVTRRAKELEDNPDVMVFYQPGWNTYVLAPIERANGHPTPQRGAVHV